MLAYGGLLTLKTREYLSFVHDAHSRRVLTYPILRETLCSCVLVHWWTIYPVPLTNCLCRWSTLSESPRFTSCLNRKMLLKTRPWRMLSCQHIGLQNKRWRIKKFSSVLTLCEHAGNNTMKFYAHSPLLRPFKFIGNGLQKCATALLNKTFAVDLPCNDAMEISVTEQFIDFV